MVGACTRRITNADMVHAHAESQMMNVHEHAGSQMMMANDHATLFSLTFAVCLLYS
jgi:hypothetical protein